MNFKLNIYYVLIIKRRNLYYRKFKIKSFFLYLCYYKDKNYNIARNITGSRKYIYIYITRI